MAFSKFKEMYSWLSSSIQFQKFAGLLDVQLKKNTKLIIMNILLKIIQEIANFNLCAAFKDSFINFLVVFFSLSLSLYPLFPMWIYKLS